MAGSTLETRGGPGVGLLPQQLRPAVAMLAGGAWSVVPPALRRLVDDPEGVVTATVDTGSDALLDAHAAWAGAPPDRYARLVPPHAFARWAMPTIARVTAKAPHPLLAVLNQGVDVVQHAPIPRGVPLTLTGQLDGVVTEPSRVRVDSTVAVDLPDGTRAMDLAVHAVVPTGRRDRDREPRTEPTWTQVGAFEVDRHDGKRFFLLTGDFNPIHTVEAVGRRTRFDGCILHGFGTMARTWELLVGAGHEMADVRVRFTAPNPLPNPRVVVEQADEPDADGRTRTRARSEDGTVHLVASVV